MPLFGGKSKAAFSHNVAAERHAGKPMDQSLAIAYRMKRKKMAGGGWTPERGVKQHEELQAKRGESYGNESIGVHSPSYSYGRDRGASMAGDLVRSGTYKKAERLEGAKDMHRQVLRELKHDKTNRKNMAHGGSVNPYSEEESHGNLISGPAQGRYGMAEGGQLTDDGYQSECSSDCNYPCDVHMSDAEGYAKGGGVHMPAWGMHQDKAHDKGESMSGMNVRRAARNMPEIGSGRSALEPAKEEHRRVLNEMKADKGDRRYMSEGGKVANSDELTAGFMPNEFDDLHLRDDLEDSYTGANSGDELGNAQEDEDRHDIVSRIMASWRKRAGHNPRPA